MIILLNYQGMMAERISLPIDQNQQVFLLIYISYDYSADLQSNIVLFMLLFLI